MSTPKPSAAHQAPRGGQENSGAALRFLESTDLERLEEANACHDNDPTRGAELLRAIDAAQLPPDRWPSCAFLINHVLGEKLHRWDEALQYQRHVLAAAQPAPAAVLWRQAATAAWLAQSSGEPGAPASGSANASAAPTAPATLARGWTEAFAKASGASVERSSEMVQLSAVMYQAPGLPAGPAGEAVLAALAPLTLPAWHAVNPLDASVAACANNIASGFLDRPSADLQNAAARLALARSAALALHFWQRAGTWVQHERALYLQAMACNALSEPREAQAHAQAALALLDKHDTEHAENVDRAFIELERRHACERLGLAADAADAQRRAQALAAEFNDAALTRWFEQREQTLKELPQR